MVLNLGDQAAVLSVTVKQTPYKTTPFSDLSIQMLILEHQILTNVHELQDHVIKCNKCS